MSWRKKSYEVLPALSVRRQELRRSLRIVTIGWMFGIIWMTCVAGGPMNYYGRMLGFTNLHFGILAALPFLMTIGQLVAAIVIERYGLQKYQFISCMGIQRLLWLVVAIIPLVLPVPSGLAVAMALTILGVSFFMAALGYPAWLTWMGALIPKRIRGRYWARRQIYTQLIKIPVVIGIAVAMDIATRSDRMSAAGNVIMTAADQPQLLWVLCGIFAFGALMGIIDVLLFRGVREVVSTTQHELRRPAVRVVVPGVSHWSNPALGGSWPRVLRPFVRGLDCVSSRAAFAAVYAGQAVRQLLVEPLGDRVFRRFVLFSGAIAAAMTAGGPFYWRHCLENLKFSQLATGILFMVVGPTSGIIACKAWGRLMDRWGRRPVLAMGTICIIFSIMPYFFASPLTPNPVFVAEWVNGAASTVGGWFGSPGWTLLAPGAPVGAWLIMSVSMIMGSAGWTAVHFAQTGVILGFSDSKGRSKYVAAAGVLIGVGGVLGGLVGGAVADALDFLQAEPIVFGAFLWNNWHATFALSLAARIIALLLLIHMPDPGSGKVREVLRYMGANVYNYVSSRLFYPLRVLGRSRSRRRNPDARPFGEDGPPKRR